LYVPEPTCHIPVLFDEVIEWLAPAPGKIFVDGTLGGGGHTEALAKAVGPTGLVVSSDLDPAARERAEVRLAGLPVKLAGVNFAELPGVLDDLGISAVDGMLLDLGLSSDQLADAERGFSFQLDGPLDLRFDPEEGESAADLLSHIGEERLADIIYQYGEERCSRRIAKRIVETRRATPIHTAGQLAELVRSCVPRTPGLKIDPATRTFQALRIAVNEELSSLEKALATFPDCLKPGGRLAIISFHSLEDRIVKHAFRNDPRLEVLTKKPILPSAHEESVNPRSRSAKLRVAARKA
jgi:16S rRNA (cytosine1402-N4)-methyltransferase